MREKNFFVLVRIWAAEFWRSCRLILTLSQIWSIQSVFLLLLLSLSKEKITQVNNKSQFLDFVLVSATGKSSLLNEAYKTWVFLLRLPLWSCSRILFQHRRHRPTMSRVGELPRSLSCSAIVYTHFTLMKLEAEYFLHCQQLLHFCLESSLAVEMAKTVHYFAQFCG